MPQELRQALADAAARSGRSLNAELVDRLERSLGRSAQHRAKDVFASAIRRGRSMTIRRRHRLLLGTLVIPAAVLAALMLAFSGSTGRAGDKTIKGGKFALSGGDPDATSATKPGLGVDAAEAYLSAERTYPANVIPTSVVQNAEATFNKISGQNDPRGLAGKFGHWDQYGP